jgi:hypothetical protein
LGIGRAAAKSAVAALFTGLAAYLAAQMALTTFSLVAFSHKLAVVALGGGAGLLAYGLMVFLLDIREARRLPQLLRNRNRTRKQPTENS